MKKIVSLLMIVTIIMSSITMDKTEEVYAATMTQDHGFSIDENLFTVKWTESGKVYVEQDVRSWDSSFDKGVELGYARVGIGFATSKKKIDGKYYQRILAKSEMVPQTVNSEKKKTGMAQYLEVEVSVGDYMYNLTIEPASSSGSTSYSITGTAGLSKTTGVGIKGNELTLNGSNTYSLGISSTTSYVEDSLSIITNKDDNGYAVWKYDYVSSGSSKQQNSYLFGSSEQYGLLTWNSYPGEDIIYGQVVVYVTATFGGGVSGTTTRAKSMGGSYHLGTNSKKFGAKSKI